MASWLAGYVQSKFEPAKGLRSFRYAYLHAACTFSNFGVITYYHSKLLENPSVTSGGYPPNHNILLFSPISISLTTYHSYSIVIIPFVQAACSTSRRTTRHTASRLNLPPKIMIPATATALEMPATRAFSRQLVAYIAAFLPTAPYFKSNDGWISAVCDDQYSTLKILEEIADEAVKVYLHDSQDPRMVPALGIPSPVRRGRLPLPRRRPRRRGERRWGCDSSASPGTVSVGRRGCFRLHRGGGRRRSGVIANRELGNVATRWQGVGHTPSKTSRLQPAPFIGQVRLCKRVHSN